MSCYAFAAAVAFVAAVLLRRNELFGIVLHNVRLMLAIDGGEFAWPCFRFVPPSSCFCVLLFNRSARATTAFAAEPGFDASS